MTDGKKIKHDSRSKKSEELINLEKAQKEIEALQQQVGVIEEKYRRALADYQNLERQTQEANKRLIKLATQAFVEELVRPYDHLRMAAAHIKDKGLDLVLTQFQQVFESQGLKEINLEEAEFDPQTMEAVEVREGEEGKVLDVVSQGYELNGIVIKPAKVVVGKKKGTL